LSAGDAENVRRIVPWRVASRACRRKNKETRVRTPLNSHGHSFSEVAAKIELAGVLVRTWIQGKDNESKAIQVVSPNICLVGKSASCRSECAIRGVRFPEAFGILRYEGCGDREQHKDQSRFHFRSSQRPRAEGLASFWGRIIVTAGEGGAVATTRIRWRLIQAGNSGSMLSRCLLMRKGAALNSARRCEVIKPGSPRSCRLWCASRIPCLLETRYICVRMARPNPIGERPIRNDNPKKRSSQAPQQS
jgi:hypothetical protein